MKNKIDQFFKDKLEGHTLPPSEEAWNKVEANLSKKNNVAVWRIAAAILIAGVLITVIIWSQRVADHQPAIVANHLPKDNSMKENGAPQNSSKEKKEVLKPAKKLLTSPQVPRNVANKEQHRNSVNTGENMPVENIPASTEEFATIEKDKSSFAKASEDKKNNKPEATPPAAIASTHQKSIKLEFTLEEFSSEPPVATAGEGKSSGLKKVWELAREVKNGDGPVREIKNELFALNFKKNKSQ